MSDVWPAQFSDGQTAKGWPARVRLDDRGIVIDRGDGEDELVWPYGALKTDNPISRNATEAHITYAHMPGATLFVSDAAFATQLSRHARQLTTTAQRWRWARPLIGAALVVAAIFAGVWLFELKPARTIAGALPESSRQAVGRNVIGYFTARFKACTAPEGKAALERMTARLLDGISGAERYSITVVNWGLVNAFAAPGGQMVITRGLIRAATSPDEVAGVLAHEIGHGVELHPEAGLIRSVGLSALIELMTGGSGGTLSNLSAMVLQNSYVRGDERAADRQALRLLKQAGISQEGLADFFERIGRKQGSSEKLSRNSFGAFDLLRTHPYPKARAALVRKTAAYPATPALDAEDWQALRKICRVTAASPN